MTENKARKRNAAAASTDIDNAPTPVGRRSDRLRLRAAWMYHVEEMTQSAIADALGIGRVTVVRLLSDARNLHEVRITLSRTVSELTSPVVGVLLELPFLITRYRTWSAWLYYAAAGFAGLALAAGAFLVLGAEHYAPWAWVLYLVLFVGSPVLFTWLGRVIAARLAKAGVARQLSPS